MGAVSFFGVQNIARTYQNQGGPLAFGKTWVGKFALFQVPFAVRACCIIMHKCFVCLSRAVIVLLSSSRLLEWPGQDRQGSNYAAHCSYGTITFWASQWPRSGFVRPPGRVPHTHTNISVTTPAVSALKTVASRAP